MDNHWLKKAQKYIRDHNAFENVSEIDFIESANYSTISATALIGLPSRFIKLGKTDLGVKSKEEVRFFFSEHFPLDAPKILLRDDFPRCFPHINPSDSNVSPCIYAGNLSELLQQSEWMNGILNQLVDWLEKAASNDLLNYDQGWEPMRNDTYKGYILYDPDRVISAFDREGNSLINKISYQEHNGFIITDAAHFDSEKTQAHIIYFRTSEIINTYLPNQIAELSQLYNYACSIGFPNIKCMVEKCDLQFINESKIFLVLAIKRPTNIIGSHTNIELLNFVIHKSDIRRKKQKQIKRVLPECKVDMLHHILDTSPTLLRRLSGIKKESKLDKNIALVGCGSLGSKIGIHLARHGNGPIFCIDDDWFMPHNNARYGLTYAHTMMYKAGILSASMRRIGVSSKHIAESALSVDYNQSQLIIDTTASLSVRNFFMKEVNLPPVISGGLYGEGRYGLLLIENKTKTSRLAALWAYLYYYSLENQSLRDLLFSSNISNVNIGQSCSSLTMAAKDAQLSLMAATMSLRIQDILESGLSNNGEILFIQCYKNCSLNTEVMSVPNYINVQCKIKRDWEILLSSTVYEQMIDFLNKKIPNETGGVLLGSVFPYAGTIVITGLLLAPPDSVEEKYRFILGKEGLANNIKDIEKKTNGKVTYLGTWHSHPQGGDASQTDRNTYKKLLFVRDYEPTVCLIVTPNNVFSV